eukprot:scaffold285056_cov24-Attheya_sp.AAC.1
MPVFVEHGSMCASSPTFASQCHWSLLGSMDAPINNRLICFDGFKVRRAFNYIMHKTKNALFSLWIRSAPPSTIPPGTVTGSHTEELDAFIQSVS